MLQMSLIRPYLVLISGQIQKTSRSFQSKQDGTDKAKKPSHPTVPFKVKEQPNREVGQEVRPENTEQYMERAICVFVHGQQLAEFYIHEQGIFSHQRSRDCPNFGNPCGGLWGN
jgi:hypothetical protein